MQISKVIKEHGLSVSEVARRMNVSKGTLSNMLSRGNMTVDTLHRIAEAAECCVADFFSDEVKDQSQTTNNAPALVCPHCGKEIEASIIIHTKEQ